MGLSAQRHQEYPSPHATTSAIFQLRNSARVSLPCASCPAHASSPPCTRWPPHPPSAPTDAPLHQAQRAFPPDGGGRGTQLLQGDADAGVYPLQAMTQSLFPPLECLRHSLRPLSLARLRGSGKRISTTRSGLICSPVSGVVESVTSAHTQPAPAVAVRKLVERAQFAQLCSAPSCPTRTTAARSDSSDLTFLCRPSHPPTHSTSPSVAIDHPLPPLPFTIDPSFPPPNTPFPLDPHFLLSPLGMHACNLQSDPRCTMLLQIPGCSGLANANVTIVGDLYSLPPSQQVWAVMAAVLPRALLLFPSPHLPPFPSLLSPLPPLPRTLTPPGVGGELLCEADIYFVGVFGMVAWTDVAEYVRPFFNTPMSFPPAHSPPPPPTSEIYFVGGFGMVAWKDVADVTTLCNCQGEIALPAGFPLPSPHPLGDDKEENEPERHITADSLEVFAQTNVLQPKVNESVFTEQKVVESTLARRKSLLGVDNVPGAQSREGGCAAADSAEFPGPLKYHTVATQLMQAEEQVQAAVREKQSLEQRMENVGLSTANQVP
ncbi:unnamed protein product [Closterium sp. Naga37s-1]|nr:unnamed protein product [Closterium sp. Naga37s-1]